MFYTPDNRRKAMNDDNTEQKISIDGVDYNLSDLTENAKTQLLNLQFVDAQIQQLNNEWAVSDTARIGYANALKAELETISAIEE